MVMRDRLNRILLLLGCVTVWMGGIASSAKGQYVPPGSPSWDHRLYTNSPGCEYLFIGAFRLVLPSPKQATNMILDKNGELVWYHQSGNYTLNLNLDPSGVFIYSDRSKWRILDSGFNLIDSLTCVGKITDHHELQITPDGHYWMMCREDRTMDVSSIKTKSGTPGSTQAQVRMVVIQELDPSKQILQEWNGWDHFTIYDSDTNYFTNPALLDLTHSNSIDVQGRKVLLSHRHLNSITQVDWSSNTVDWEMSGKNNAFDLGGDPGFYGQHDARYLPGGRISLFDNGNFHHLARGLVLQVDDTLMTSTILASYGNTVVSESMGSMQVLDDNSVLINYGQLGANATVPPVVQYAPDSSTRMSLDFGTDYMTYRARCLDIPFDLDRPGITCSQVGNTVTLGVDGVHSSYEWTNGETGATIVLADTGRYQVFVPKGIGMLSSRSVHVTDLANACLQVGNDPVMVGSPRPAKLIGRWDLLGRPVEGMPERQVIVERWSDGTVRKVFSD